MVSEELEDLSSELLLKIQMLRLQLLMIHLWMLIILLIYLNTTQCMDNSKVILKRLMTRQSKSMEKLLKSSKKRPLRTLDGVMQVQIISVNQLEFSLRRIPPEPILREGPRKSLSLLHQRMMLLSS